MQQSITNSCLYLLISVTLLVEVANSNIIHASGLIRHGAEFPKNDLYDGAQTKQFRGQITPVGMRQQYNLGACMKRNYITEEKVTTPKFDPTQLEFFATSYKRTHYSALAFLYGLFPLNQGWTIPPQVPAERLNPPYTPLFPSNLRQQDHEEMFALDQGFQPLPIHNFDAVLNDCPLYDNLLEKRKILIASQVSSFEEKYKRQIERMKTLFKLTDSQANLPTMADLYETIYADLNLGRQMPAEFTESDLKDLRHMSDLYNTLLYNGDFAKVTSTVFLRHIKLRLYGALKGLNIRLSLAFGHQSNLHPLVTLLNLTSTSCLQQKRNNQPITSLNCVDTPQYAANLVFELHQRDDKSHFVKIKYNGYYVNICQRKSTECDYDEFDERLWDMMGDFEGECGIANQKVSDSNN